jgi:hypothetical protein
MAWQRLRHDLIDFVIDHLPFLQPGLLCGCDIAVADWSAQRP